jgi:hypothetical protein
MKPAPNLKRLGATLRPILMWPGRFAGLFGLASARADACPFCYSAAASAKTGAIHASQNGILILTLPPILIFAAIGVMAFRRRHRYHDPGMERHPPLGTPATKADRRMTRRPYSRWLHRYSVFVACATFLLIIAGALVTSNDAGLSVPDWATSFGSFRMPRMVGGVKFEHGHRMAAGVVTILTIMLAFWIWRSDSRRWVRRLAGLSVAHHPDPGAARRHHRALLSSGDCLRESRLHGAGLFQPVCLPGALHWRAMALGRGEAG